MSGKTFPEVGESAEAAACFSSRAPKIVDAFDRDVVIRSSHGLFLAIPTAAAGESGRNAVDSCEKTEPGGWKRQTGLKLLSLQVRYVLGRATLTHRIRAIKCLLRAEIRPCAKCGC
ncbi:hypothetical protein [Rhizobium oryzicola]|uniref:Uncharacterized protein n=1 Tax=Rhizobium oryzicola TaxID=1232668 RepID=A0ABT8STW7_9HYPH|nr:hypothetical protein [Rhizobium oryzicola]MDO1581466.1 hypothetical protein [Rhizobium oryzicola]